MVKKTDQQVSKLSPDLQYELVRSRRKTLSLIVLNDGALEIRCPLTYPRSQVDDFVQSKADWIHRKRQENQYTINIDALPLDQKMQAHALIQTHFNKIAIDFTKGKPANLSIRDQRSRWGSCSNRGNISINSRCSLLPFPLLEYVIIHELCHLVYLNHSAAFWKLLESYLPDARQRRQILNRYRLV